MRVAPRKKNKSDYRSSQRNMRLEMAENRCEVCGRQIDRTCHIFHRLPVGTPDRNKVENIRVMCGECWHNLEKHPHIHGFHHLEAINRPELSIEKGTIS